MKFIVLGIGIFLLGVSSFADTVLQLDTTTADSVFSGLNVKEVATGTEYDHFFSKEAKGKLTCARQATPDAPITYSCRFGEGLFYVEGETARNIFEIYQVPANSDGAFSTLKEASGTLSCMRTSGWNIGIICSCSFDRL